MKPRDPNDEAAPSRRATLYLTETRSLLMHAYGMETFNSHVGLLDYLASSTTFKPFGQLWLVPDSPSDWRVLVLPLLLKGYSCGASQRANMVSTLRVYSPKDSGLAKLFWHGRSSSGVVNIAGGLSPEDQCASALAQLDMLDDAIRRRFPSVSFGASLTSTAIELFRTFLDHELLVDPQVEVSLRRAGAVGGGRQEMFVAPGTVCQRAGLILPNNDGRVTEGSTPVDLDITSAYPTALEIVPIGCQIAATLGESSYKDPCTLSVALVDVPEHLFGPLRYEPGASESSSCYPTGTLWGAWTAAQLAAAETIGCKVVHVIETWRFAEEEVFARFGHALRVWRQQADSKLEGDLVKQLAVRAVGAMLMSPRESRLYCTKDLPAEYMDGALSLGYGVYEVPAGEKQRDGALVPAGVQVIGAVQAWVALLLRGAEIHDAEPLYIHTDGGAFAWEDGAIAAVRWAADHGGPPIEGEPAHQFAPDVRGPYRMGAWRFTPLDRITVWAPGQRHEERSDGTKRTAGAGLSRELTEAEIIRRTESAEHLAELDRKSAGARVWENGRSRAPSAVEVDPELAPRFEALVSLLSDNPSPNGFGEHETNATEKVA